MRQSFANYATLRKVIAGGGGDADAASLVALREMHARKTGALFRAAAVAGAIMGGGTATQIHAIDRFAAEVGLAYQIIDDILDEESTAPVRASCTIAGSNPSPFAQSKLFTSSSFMAGSRSMRHAKRF